MITIRAGNLLDSPSLTTLVCPTNTLGRMGAGLAREFARRYRHGGLEDAYRTACQRGEVQPARVWLWSPPWGLLGGPPLVVCLPTKRDWRDPSRLDDVNDALDDLARRVPEWGICALAVPALGCGHGGLAWDQVEPLIRQHLGPLTIPVDVYPPVERA